SAMVWAQLMDVNPSTKERLDYVAFAGELEKKIRDQYKNDKIDIHIVGFAKVVGDVADAIKGVIMFFGIAIIITFILVYLYSHSLKLTLAPIICSIVAVIWQLGLLTALGFGLDPMSILVPFLVFAIGVSHGMQMINAAGNLIAGGESPIVAARAGFHGLLIPGTIALVSDTVGFLTLLLIKIGVIQELAITASIGVAVIILTNLFLLPLVLSYLKFDKGFNRRMGISEKYENRLWEKISGITLPRAGAMVIFAAIVLFVFGFIFARQMKIGDLHAGASVLHDDSRYNLDNAQITKRFSIGTDIISVIVETSPDACIEYEVMSEIDRFQWHMENVEGVQSALSLPKLAKIVNSAFNEGNLKWKTLPRNKSMLIEATRPIPSSSGFLNSDCSVMPVMIFTKDHKAETIEKIVAAAKAYVAQNPSDKLSFNLATGQVGVMAATNESVKAAQLPMLLWIYAAVTGLCLITFRSIRA
ncbi:MAG: MMPL family transporter, partial [Desulfobacterales bacterium]|nr:MMPL family transporter [Desulfobacterales bacterium]